MATLIPHNGNRYLMPVEVIRRVEAAFPYVETTPEGAHQRVMEWMSQLAFVGPEGRAADFGEELSRLEAVQDDALYLCFGDELDDDALVSVLMVPGQPLYVDPPEQARCVKAAALIARCAAALDYAVA